jgi:hypothetical protein
MPTLRTRLVAGTIPLLALSAVALTAMPAQAAPTTATRISKMVRGTNLKAEADGRAPANPLCSSNARQSMRDFRTTGGNTVSFVIPLVQDTVTSSAITRREDTPSDACLTEAIKNARAEHLDVVLKPLLELRHGVDLPTASGGTFHSVWRGRIHPAHPDLWQKQWNYWMLHYGRIGLDNGAKEITIATEMQGVTIYQKTKDGVSFSKGNPARFIALTDQIHRQLPGLKVGLAMTLSGEPEYLSKTLARKVDRLGVTFYPKLDIKGDLTEGKVESGLKAYTKTLRKRSDRLDRKLTVYEFGYRSRRGTHEQTADGTRGGVVDLKEQAILYSATFKTLNGERDVAGLYTWLWNTDPESGGPGRSDYTIQNKPDALAVQAKWFGGTVPAER